MSLKKFDLKSKDILTLLFFYGISNKNHSYILCLHSACESGNLEVVKYLVSLNQIDMLGLDISI